MAPWKLEVISSGDVAKFVGMKFVVFVDDSTKSCDALGIVYWFWIARRVDAIGCCWARGGDEPVEQVLL